MDATADLSLSIMSSSLGLPSKGSLLESLIQVSNEVTSIGKLPFLQVRNVTKMMRRIKLLSSLYEEIQDTDRTISPASILCLTELFSVIRRAQSLIQGCKEGSSLWNLMQTEVISNQFSMVVKEMGRALDILPLSLLNLTPDTREQVELLHKQAKRGDLFIDLREVERRDEIFLIMAANNEKKNFKNKDFINFETLNNVFKSIGLTNTSDYDQEISKLDEEVQKQAGTGGLIVVSNIKNLKSLLSLSKAMIFSEEETKKLPDSVRRSTSFRHQDRYSSASNSMVLNIPDEYRCPISLDLMKDPVIIASGHTYDRNSIARWINSGHHTCPKSGQRLIHMALIPNYALKSLIHQWSQENNIPLIETTHSPSSSSTERSNSNRKLCESEKAIDPISETQNDMNTVKMTAEFLVGKLAMGSTDIQRQAAHELRILAKTGMDNRRLISEAGAIPFLVTLLSSQDPILQEHVVTTLLNLSILDNNKILIMSAGALDSIIRVLQSGKTMEAKENAAATIFSLSMIDDYKVIIGSNPKAIPSLVALLGEGTTSGKKDASTALFNLALYNINRVSVVISGAVPLLIDLLTDDKAGITDDSLQVLVLLLGCSEGLKEIRKGRVLVPLLIDLLRFGSPKGKENLITLLLGLCKDGGEEVARRLLMNPCSIPSLQSLAVDGSLKARRKADALLRLLNRCFSQSRTSVDNKGMLEN